MKRVAIVLVLVVLILACVCALFACSNSDSDKATPSNYIISFNTNGGNQIKSLTLKSGSPLILPEPPTRDGFVFIGWFLDNKLEREVNPALFKVVSNVTIFAGWESVETYRHQILTDEYEEGVINILEPADKRASMGTEVIVSVVPESGYEIRYNSLKANNILLEYESGNRYKFTMPAEQVTISAIFDLKPMPVTALSMIQNGEIVLSTDSARRGDLVTVQAIPDYGYRLTELYIVNNDAVSDSDDLRINIMNLGSFYMGSSETLVGATFEKINYETSYKIHAVSSQGGRVIVSADESPAGLFIKLDFEADEGYILDRYTIQGEGILSLISSMQEGFIMPDENVTITATFIKESSAEVINELIITQSEFGKINLINPKNHYKKGELVEFEVVPNVGYAIEKVYVNGLPVLGNSFRMPSTKATITSEFIPMGYDVGVVASNCIVKVSQKTAYPGEIVYFEIEESDGYKVNPSKITLNGTIITGNSFVMPDGDVSLNVVAYATGSTHNIIVQEVVGGYIIATQTEATIYSKISLVAVPDEGYRFKKGSYVISYTSHGENKSTQISGDSFVMLDTDVMVSGAFEKVYSVSAVDDGKIGLYPSAMEMVEGENIYIQFVSHGNIIADSIAVMVDFGAYTEPLNSSRVFEITPYKVVQAGVNPRVTFRYVTYSEIDANRLYTLSVESNEKGAIVAPNTARYGDMVRLKVDANQGYKLSTLVVSTNDGSYYPISDTFVMPDSAVTIKATFVESPEKSFGLKNQYENNVQGFLDAMIKVVYYRENYQLIDAYPALESNPFINYIVGAVKVDAKYGHDFYILEVDDISRVSPIAYEAHEFIAENLNVDKSEINVKIKYNYIILSVGGSPEEDFYVYRNGVKAIGDFILYEREDGSYGVYAYTGNSDYVSIIDSYNGRSVSYLSSKAFSDPHKIKGISLGNLTEIGDFALENTDIIYVDIKGVQKLGKGVFKGTNSLKAITVSSYNSSYYTLAGVLYERGKSATATLYCYPHAKKSLSDSFEIPSQTQKIAPYAFYGSTLKVVSYGGALTTMGEYAFAYSDVESIKYTATTAMQGLVDFSNTNINKSVVSVIGEGAFKGASKLTSFYLDSVTEIGDNAISWDGTTDLVIKLSGDNNGVVKANVSPIEMPLNRVGMLKIYIPNELESLYRNARGWKYYQPYLILG
ncbi:MAG: leucine-rich repeat protein [Clostridia bacterium]|nr:leucine-rich repeat protein [Clostridia bacterium]